MEADSTSFIQRWLISALAENPESGLVKAISDFTEGDVLDEQGLLKNLIALARVEDKGDQSVPNQTNNV